MATINDFHPLIFTHLQSQKCKSQVFYVTFHSPHLSTRNQNPRLADHRSSSFTKMPFDHQFRSHHRLLTMVTQATDKSQPEAQLPAKHPLSSWSDFHISGKTGKVDMAVDTVESMADVVEELTEEVDKVAEEVAEKLPQDAKLKKAVESTERLAEEAVKKAELAKDVIHKVEEVEKEVEEALTNTTAGSDQKP